MKIALREVLLLGLLGAILIVVQVGLAIIPNIELVSFLIIVYTLVLGRKVFFPIYIFVAVEGLIYGFGTWWINYLYVWAVLALVVLLLRKNEHPMFWAIVSGMFGLLFGALCSVIYLFIGGVDGYGAAGINTAAAYWISSIPYDLLHCAGNAVIAALLFKPMYKIMKRLYAREKKI